MAGKALIATALLLGGFTGVSSAAITTGGAPTPAGGPPPPGSPTGAPADGPSAGALSVISATTSPRKSFYFGVRYPRLSYTIASTQAQNDLRIDVIDSSGAVIRSFYRNDVAPGVANTIRWDGDGADRRPARNGRYSFRIAAQTGIPAARPATRSSSLELGFALYGFAFPLLGDHDFGASAGRFGAGRSGHTHQGQDVMADCGVPIVAARGGRVQYSGFQDAAGNYVVIDAKGSTLDTAYMHLAQPSPLRTGDLVRTGQPIGVVGQTGDATACHLHFEIWTAPGWYEGGSPIDPLPYLTKWDRYS
ncbi:MAG TPA: peptidoglycan DD-metalloendopeptidase family protein [Solirubrobacterales bacterium]